jgi:hypothetical protein
VTYTVDFAPSEYLEALRDENPGFRFSYVPSVSARVDLVGPELNDIGERLKGRAILSASWSDAARARSKNPIAKAALARFETEELTEKGRTSLEKLGELQNPTRFENSLSGGKFLHVELSTFGHCALKNGESILPGEKGERVKSPYKLALYYTYPEYYKLKVRGSQSSHRILHDVWKFSSKSSWFGMSKKKKIEHMQTYRSNGYMDIRVEPEGIELSLAESLELTNKIKDLLLFDVLRPHLETQERSRPTGDLLQPDKPGQELGQIGGLLAVIPNPWLRWTGVIMGSLGGMFGRSSSEVVTHIDKKEDVGVYFENGVVLESAGEAVIGNLYVSDVE